MQNKIFYTIETGIYEWERYIDASKTPKWEEIGIEWLVNNIDPDN